MKDIQMQLFIQLIRQMQVKWMINGYLLNTVIPQLNANHALNIFNNKRQGDQRSIYIDQFVSTYDYIRPLTRLRDLISTPSEMCCNDTIQFSIDMHCMCKYGRTNEYIPVCIFVFIHLIVILCMLNNIESHNVINNNLWNRYDVGSAPIVLAHHRTVSRAYLCHAIVSRMTSFASCINQCIFTNDQIMVTRINAIKSGMSRYCPN